MESSFLVWLSLVLLQDMFVENFCVQLQMQNLFVFTMEDVLCVNVCFLITTLNFQLNCFAVKKNNL